MRSRYWRDHIGELTGTLCLVQLELSSVAHRNANVWLLTDSVKSIWVKVYTIPVNPQSKYKVHSGAIESGAWWKVAVLLLM